VLPTNILDIGALSLERLDYVGFLLAFSIDQFLFRLTIMLAVPALFMSLGVNIFLLLTGLLAPATFFVHILAVFPNRVHLRVLCPLRLVMSFGVLVDAELM
jgi:hypothetical protein